MSTLEIRKLQSGAFKHVDSIDGEFFLGRFSFKNEFNIAFLVEAYGAKRRTYSIGDITVYNYLGTVENFTNFTDLINRLVALNYTGIDTNNIVNGFLSEDPTTYTPATLPLTGTEVAILNDGTNWVKITWNNIITSLSSVFQAILVSGTNIKTINGSSVLGSGNLVVGGGSSDIIIDIENGLQTQIATTERVAGNNAYNNLSFLTGVTKSGSLLTGPYEMHAKRVLKTGTAKKLTYRYFPDGLDLSIILRVYAFKQNKDSTSIFDCRLLFQQTLTATSAYTIQKHEFLTASFSDSNLIDGEFLAFTCQKTTSLGNLFLYSQNLTLTY